VDLDMKLRWNCAVFCAYHLVVNIVRDRVEITHAISMTGGSIMARKTVLVCDSCGKEVEEGKGAVLRVTFNDARRGAKAADLCDSCAGGMPGAAVARRGRKPKSLA
jgi:hypothetical protein